MPNRKREETVPLYEQILFQHLKVPREFLREHAQVIRDKLRCAAGDLTRENGDLFAINQCLHLASSVVLRNADHLGETLAAVREHAGLKELDPTTVVTVATLCYLLQAEIYAAPPPEDRERLQRLWRRFDAINWLVGTDAMRVLGIETGGL
jgi:hypothetical protein